MSASFLNPRDAATDEENSEAESVSSSELESLISNTEEVELPKEERDNDNKKNIDKSDVSISEVGELEIFNTYTSYTSEPCEPCEPCEDKLAQNNENANKNEEQCLCLVNNNVEDKSEIPQNQSSNVIDEVETIKEDALNINDKLNAEEALQEELIERECESDTVVGREYKRASLDWGDICEEEEEEEKKKAEAEAEATAEAIAVTDNTTMIKKEEPKVNWADMVEVPDEEDEAETTEARNASNVKIVKNEKTHYKSDFNNKKTKNYNTNKNERNNHKNYGNHGSRRRQRYSRWPDYDSDPNLTWRKKEEPKEIQNISTSTSANTKQNMNSVTLLKKEIISQPHGRYEEKQKKYEFKSKDDSWIDKKVIVASKAPERRFKRPEKKSVVKEDDPCEIPTSGRFYMHDDRTSSNRRREPRFTRKEENSKLPEGKWKHDKFEELEREFEEKLKLERTGGKDLSRYYYKRYPNNKENNRNKYEDQYYADDDEYYYEEDVRYKRREKTWNRSYLENNQQGNSSSYNNRKDRQQFSHLDINYGSNYDSHIEYMPNELKRDDFYKNKKESSKWLTVPSMNAQQHHYPRQHQHQHRHHHHQKQDRKWQSNVTSVSKDGYKRNDDIYYRKENKKSHSFDQQYQYQERNRNYKVYDEYEEAYISSPVFTEDIWHKVPDTHDKVVSAEWHD